MDVLVGKLNFLMTDVDMSTLLSERKEPVTSAIFTRLWCGRF